MKNRTIITISDIKGTKSYSISGLLRKYILRVIVFIVLTASIGAIVVPILINKIMDLATKNEMYKQDLEEQITAYDKVDDDLKELQENIKMYEEGARITLQKTKEYARIASVKTYILKILPNGSPVARPRVTSSFGYRIHPIFHTKKMHNGIDFKTNIGTPIKSTADGFVTRVVSSDTGGYGKLVVIRHPYGFDTAYAHLSSIKVSVGQKVKRGQLIALSGNSGRSTGPHLHYEVHFLAKPINPIDFVRWNMVNYDSIFNIQKGIPWASLVNLVQKQHPNLATTQQ
ncbi:MAG: M23 family metallopeptidase [Sulfurovaceae bacterium]|nr:M23 family metallopeptidase [Sulfurovaceae bacterium]MDD5548807.1 M23 family metallopeptidase [Sulfurovaceae bacterium]